ncbi:hypothetical protein, partial [Methylomonas koyamae]|uniref:hypothetical protein n=1 Tax=Methylomonas koyamae TaxID=702114 RepID=UPI001E53DC6E
FALLSRHILQQSEIMSITFFNRLSTLKIQPKNQSQSKQTSNLPLPKATSKPLALTTQRI